VVITGASRGLGKEQARRFIQKGYHVIGTLRKQEDADAWKEEAPLLFTAVFMDTAKPE
jgi:short-subunit dehydrogenase